MRYVGDPVAFVVAETAKQARDAAEAVFVDIDPLPAVTTARDAAASGAPLVHDETPGNLVLDFHHGDSRKGRRRLRRRGARHQPRHPQQPDRRVADGAALGDRRVRRTMRFTLRLGCQGAFGMRGMLKNVLGVPVEKVRVLTGNVGGSFGMKASVYPEYICLLHAARALGRPVKWTDERSESFLSDSHGRDHEMTASSWRSTPTGISSACGSRASATSAPISAMPRRSPPTMNAVKNSIGVYRDAGRRGQHPLRCSPTPRLSAPIAAPGRPEGNYYIERLLDTAAAELGIDRVEIRRRNHIRPEQMPYKAPGATEYDSGDFPGRARQGARAGRLGRISPAPQPKAVRRGQLRGRGIGQYLEVTAPPQNEMGGIRFEPDGTVTIITGTLDYGQGHASPFAQVLSARLGIPFEQIRLLQGDSDQLIAGGGTGGSKSIMASGAAIVEAGEKVIENGRHIAAHALEAAVADIEFCRGPASPSPAPTAASASWSWPSGCATGARACRRACRTRSTPSWSTRARPRPIPNGCHVCEVEVDPETGRGRRRALRDGQRFRRRRSTRCWSRARRMAASCRASARR